jgi:phosphoserine phosphatase
LAGIPELVQKLQGRGCQVFLVSGGFRAIINPIAAILSIPQDHVFANTILFKVTPHPCQTLLK